jgi:Fe-S cluster assembly ATPase SufC
MKTNLTFQERAKLGMEQLAKQQPTTLQEALAQVAFLKSTSTSKERKKN